MTGRLADAILVARDLLKRQPQVTSERLQAHPLVGLSCGRPNAGIAVFENVADLNATNLMTAIQKYAAAERGLFDFTIRIKDIPAAVAQISSAEEGGTKSPDRIIRSILLRYEDRADILLVDNLNICWRRFAICKEFAHLIMEDGHGTRAVSVSEQISMAFAIARNPDPARELSSEEFAWFTAVELLLPINDRLQMMSRHGAGEDHLSLARSYWVPRAIIDIFFETPYGEVSNSLR